ncbi:glycoside hydrolase family 5 protein [Maribacter algarum]|uniref:Glycoside hydrolase family 5 protein n=1 Tax=Maribacter algarum (ex Zhang et al. 2020) TaxID=2578118 RepID=A0A5S3PML2_9FLAO|nr:cellulase family glycosylhydrolase [Maribacter algarum]TMM53656.1 glycoside hydrolase family 5 protein [Maribacter algarum]
MKKILLLTIAIIVFSCAEKKKEIKSEEIKTVLAERWSKEKAWEWYDKQPWLVGTNFNPSSSINQLEFWQADTFDPETIDRELKWSADLGMNLHRVYLHNLLWEQDSLGFLNHLEEYLKISDSHGIKTMFVLLDDVWHPIPKLGKQPEPIPHVHNSGWVQAPGAEILGDSTRHDEVKNYIKGVLTRFGNDDRVLVWDVYNEPDNVAGQPGRKELEVENKHDYSLKLLKKVMRWSREVNPKQPLTTGIWRGNIDHWGTLDSLPALDRYMIENSDVISFHTYDGDMNRVGQKIAELKKFERPLLCTEYLARATGNTFETVMSILKENKIAAINWGFVAGKTNTIYPWKSWDSTFTSEPKLWHHDILRLDGTPFSEGEVAYIKKMTRKIE